MHISYQSISLCPLPIVTLISDQLCQRQTFLNHHSFLIFLGQHLGYVYLLLTITSTLWSHAKWRSSGSCNEINLVAIWRKKTCFITWQPVKIYKQTLKLFWLCYQSQRVNSFIFLWRLLNWLTSVLKTSKHNLFHLLKFQTVATS